MNGHSQFVENEGPVSQYEYDDGTVVFAADVGPGRTATVDVVGDTVIVVAGDEQYEFSLPGDDSAPVDAEAFMRNGVLTVEVEG
jgi:hypothetical protein